MPLPSFSILQRVIVAAWLIGLIWSILVFAQITTTELIGRHYSGQITEATPVCPSTSKTIYCGQFWTHLTVSADNHTYFFDDPSNNQHPSDDIRIIVNPISCQVISETGGGFTPATYDAGLYLVASLIFSFFALGFWLKNDGSPWRNATLRFLDWVTGYRK